MGQTKPASVHVTLGSKKQTFWKDPTDNSEWWGALRKSFVATRRKDGKEAAFATMGLQLSTAIDPEKIKFSCWKVLELHIKLCSTVWGPMWLWKLNYDHSDVKLIAFNSTKRDELWNPAKDGKIAEDITPKDGTLVQLSVVEETENDAIPVNVTEVQRLYEANLQRQRERKAAELQQVNIEIDALPVAVLENHLSGKPLTASQLAVLNGERVKRSPIVNGKRVMSKSGRKSFWQQSDNADAAMKLQAQDVAGRHGISLPGATYTDAEFESLMKAMEVHT